MHYENKFLQSLNFKKLNLKKKQNIGILLWTNHYSYKDPFNSTFVDLNFYIFDAAYKLSNKKLDTLIIKFHHRIPRPDKTYVENIKNKFSNYAFNVLTFDEIFNYETHIRIYPIEFFNNIFKPISVIGSCSAALFNYSNVLTCKTFSAFTYKNKLLNRLKFVINGNKSINRLSNYSPKDLSKDLHALSK